MSTPLETLNAKAALLDEIASTRGRLFGERLTPERRNIEEGRLTELVGQQIAIEEAEAAAAQPAPVLPDGGKSLTPAEAREKANAIGKDPRFWDPHKRDEKGVRLSAAEYDRLVRERSELLARAAEVDGSAGGTEQ